MFNSFETFVGFVAVWYLCLTALLIPPVIKVANFPVGLSSDMHPHGDTGCDEIKWGGGYMISEGCRGTQLQVTQLTEASTV